MEFATPKDAHPATWELNIKLLQKEARELWDNYGPPSLIKIRRKFVNAAAARRWEATVLRRMKVAERDDFLNKHSTPAPPVLWGDSNYSKLPQVRKKLSETALAREADRRKKGNYTHVEKASRTKIKSGIIKILRNSAHLKNSSELRNRLSRHINFVKSHKPNCTRIIVKLETILQKLETAPRNVYPKNRKSAPMSNSTRSKISKARSGKMWYYCPVTGENKCVLPELAPEGWLPGLNKNTPNNNTAEVCAKISQTHIRLRSQESEEKQKQRLEKYHATIKERRRQKNNPSGNQASS